MWSAWAAACLFIWTLSSVSASSRTLASRRSCSRFSSRAWKDSHYLLTVTDLTNLLLQLSLQLLHSQAGGVEPLLLQRLPEPLLLHSLLLGQLLLQEHHLLVGVSDEHVQLLLGQLAVLLP